MPADIELLGVTIQHLRGFTNASVDFDRRMLLVGQNNSGKSSLFILLDAALNWDLAVLSGERPLTSSEEKLLLPSRDSRGRARRLTLRIRIHDSRRHSRFRCTDGVANLRLTVRSGQCQLNVSPPTRRPQLTEQNAVSLLTELRDTYEYLWVPAGYGAQRDLTERFRASLLEGLLKKTSNTAPGGKPSEYRDLKQIRDVASPVSMKLAEGFQESLNFGVGRSLIESFAVQADVPMDAVARWVSAQINVSVSTGDHDVRGVDPEELGSGLQSLLLLGLHRQRHDSERPRLLLAVEEPEAHLHPSLQHEVARDLLTTSNDESTVIVTTHSAAIVAEAKYGQTSLVKRHKYYRPAEANDAQRDAINTLLMQGRSAEAFFADSVLLVEGPGDYRFFDAIRRRLVTPLGFGPAERLFCLDVGSNTRFGPWIRLFRSYGVDGDRPIEWSLLCDGDSTSTIVSGLAASGQLVPQAARSALSNLGSAAWNDPPQRLLYATGASVLLQREGLRSRILPLDFEWELVSGARPAMRRRIALLVGLPADAGVETVARKLGSKVTSGRASDSSMKDPWLRAEIGKLVGWDDLTDALKDTLVRWVLPIAKSRAEAETVLKRLL